MGTAAMLHFIVAMPNMQVERSPADCLGPSYHESSIDRNPQTIEDPQSTLNNFPGLGIDADWDLVASQQAHVE
jgi:hypothetical protein